MLLTSSRCLAGDISGQNCDPGLQAAGGTEVAYRPRGDRCEGLYVQEVAGGTLQIVSLTASFKTYKFEKDKPLLLEWPVVGDAQVQVRASSLKRKLYYRMDMLRSQKPPGYTWPSDVLSRLQLGRDEIGLLAWTDQPVAGGKRRTYLPLRVTPQGSPTPPDVESYTVVLMSSVGLQAVYVTLCPVDSDGKPAKPIRKDSKLVGYHPAERPILLPILFSELTGAPSGLYSLSVGAEASNGDPRKAPEICFFHPRAGHPWPKENGGKP